jgi:hypothetical protein
MPVHFIKKQESSKLQLWPKRILASMTTCKMLLISSLKVEMENRTANNKNFWKCTIERGQLQIIKIAFKEGKAEK